MQQITRAIYSVDTGETITLTVTASKVGDFATASFRGSPLTATGTSPLTYEFKIAATSGNSDFLSVFVHFDNAAPDDATFQLSFAGSNGGSFTGPDIQKTDALWNRGVRFTAN